MPTVPFNFQKRLSRIRDQRWLLDTVIKVVGPEFDQSRLQYLSAPMTPDYKDPVMGLQRLLQRWDDIAPEFTGLARRFKLQARSALAQGHVTTASDGFFAASALYGGAQWPIFANTDLNRTLEQKNECFQEYAKNADHHVEQPRSRKPDL